MNQLVEHLIAFRCETTLNRIVFLCLDSISDTHHCLGKILSLRTFHEGIRRCSLFLKLSLHFLHLLLVTEIHSCICFTEITIAIHIHQILQLWIVSHLVAILILITEMKFVFVIRLDSSDIRHSIFGCVAQVTHTQTIMVTEIQTCYRLIIISRKQFDVLSVNFSHFCLKVTEDIPHLLRNPCNQHMIVILHIACILNTLQQTESPIIESKSIIDSPQFLCILRINTMLYHSLTSCLICTIKLLLCDICHHTTLRRICQNQHMCTFELTSSLNLDDIHVFHLSLNVLSVLNVTHRRGLVTHHLCRDGGQQVLFCILGSFIHICSITKAPQVSLTIVLNSLRFSLILSQILCADNIWNSQHKQCTKHANHIILHHSYLLYINR